MQMRIEFGSQERHELIIEHGASDAAVAVLVDGKRMAQCPLAEDGDHVLCWFSTAIQGAQKILVKLRYRSKAVEGVQVLVEPTQEQLRALGLARLAGCEYASEHAASWLRMPWTNLTMDLGAFVGSGFRFHLSHLMGLVLLYALAMVPTYVSILQRCEKVANNAADPAWAACLTFLLAWCSVAWIILLVVAMGSAVGYSLRNPAVQPERRGWIHLSRLTTSLAMGAGICALLIENYR